MLEGLRVVHAPLEIAGQVGTICKLLHQHGIHAVGYNYFPNYLNYQDVFETDSYELAKLLEDMIDFYDVFHFHNGYTFLDDSRDIMMIRDAGKPIIMHHRGNDVRSRRRARRWKDYENLYVNADSSLPDEMIDRNLRFHARHVSAAIVQDHELLPYVEDYYAAEGKKVYVLPRLFDVSRSEPVTDNLDATQKDEVWIVHAPTQRDFKGTDYINEAVKRIQEELPIRYMLVEGMSHAEAVQCYKQADILIDQVLCGAYGNLSIEGMALGKPVICYIRPDLLDRYPTELPIVSANPDTLYGVLRDLVLDAELRSELGRRGRAYVEQYHDAATVIQKLVSIYREVLEMEGMR